MAEVVMVFRDRDKELLGEALKAKFPFLRGLKAMRIETSLEPHVKIVFDFDGAPPPKPPEPEKSPEAKNEAPEPREKPAEKKPTALKEPVNFPRLRSSH